MIRPQLLPRFLKGEKHFRWRGGAVSRLEALSDAVFALSLTLLVVSLEVPRDFADMKVAFNHLPAFAICFAMLLMLWYYNFIFHRRFGLEDFGTIVLNGLLLFLILFYVYPLKFLFTYLVDVLILGQPPTVRIASRDMPLLMILYSSGFAGISLLYAMLNLRAYCKHDELGLDARELVVTRSAVQEQFLSLGIALLSITIVLVNSRWTPWAGIIYCLMGPVHGVYGWRVGRRLDRMLELEEGRTSEGDKEASSPEE